MTVAELKSALNCIREDADVYFDFYSTGPEPESDDGSVLIRSFTAKNPGANNFQLILSAQPK